MLNAQTISKPNNPIRSLEALPNHGSIEVPKNSRLQKIASVLSKALAWIERNYEHGSRIHAHLEQIKEEEIRRRIRSGLPPTML